jgi:hypothetical protein
MGYDRQDELARLLDGPDTTEALDQVEAIVREQCVYSTDKGNGKLFSGFIGVFASAMVLLGERGRIKVTSDNGGRVVEAHIL